MLDEEVELMSSLQPVGREAPDTEPVLPAVSRLLGGLTPEEDAALYGTIVAQRYAPGAAGVSLPQVTGLSQALGAFRAAPCRYCHLGLTAHSLDLTPDGVDVRCGVDQSSRSLTDWLATPTPSSGRNLVWAGVLWVGIPLLSVGILSWVMPAVAAGLYRRRSWALAAVVLLIVTVVGLVVTPMDPNEVDPVADTLLMAAWLGGAGYGAFQIKPWVRARST